MRKNVVFFSYLCANQPNNEWKSASLDGSLVFIALSDANRTAWGRKQDISDRAARSVPLEENANGAE